MLLPMGRDLREGLSAHRAMCCRRRRGHDERCEGGAWQVVATDGDGQEQLARGGGLVAHGVRTIVMVDNLGAHASAVARSADVHVKRVAAVLVADAFVAACDDREARYLAHRGTREAAA